MKPLRHARHLAAVLPVLLLLSACSHNAKKHRDVVGSADTSALARQLDTVLHRRDQKGVRYAARVVDLRTGQELYAHDIDSPVMPASNGKLSVTAAALDRFGAGYTFPTYLAMDGSDLWLNDTGNT